MPDDEGEECGEPDSDGYVRERIQTNGRCEVANGRGDTYGPVSYLAYVPGFVTMGYDYEWDYLPAAHFTSLLWDALALIGLGALGFRFGGLRLGVTLAFAWAAYPFTQYVSSSNSNDAIMPALLIWGLVFVTSAPARGLFVGLAAWTKFASLLLLPLWASYPKAWKWPRQQLLFAAGFLAATLLAFWVLLLEPDPIHAARVFWDRTFGWQLSRESPFSIWDWNEYPGYPDLHVLQTVLEGAPGGRGRRARLRAAHAERRPARRPHRRAADRLRARPDALVLPLHPLVLPLRRLRGARAGGGPGGRARAAPGGFGR